MLSRHRCTHNLGQQNRVINTTDNNKCHVTEYKGRFEDITPKQRPFLRPKDLIRQEGETNTETTNATSFIAHSVQPPKAREPEKFVPNPHKFDTVSEHHAHYKELNGIPAKIPPYLKTTTMRKPSGKIIYRSTKQEDFKWNSLPNRGGEIVTREKPYRPPSKPFQGTSIHRQDYTRFNQAPNPTARQPDKINFGKSPVNFETTSMAFHKPLQAIASRSPIAEPPREVLTPPVRSAFTSTSVFRGDFVDYKTAKSAQIYKPESNLFKTSDSMSSETTKATAFQAWPLESRQRKPPEIYKKPEGLFQAQQTSRDYSNHGDLAIPAKSARPRTKLQRGREFPFNPTTSYSQEFKGHEMLPPRRDMMRQSANNDNEIFPKSSDPLTFGTSEFLDKYKRHQALPAKMFKGDSGLFQTSSKISDQTLYKEQFRGDKIECPSEKLLRGDPLGNMAFDHVSEEGHKVYDISTRETDQQQLRREVTVA